MYYLRSGSCYRGAIGVPHGVADYMMICLRVQDKRLIEGIGARNPRRSLARSTSTDETVCDRIAFAHIDIICRLTVRTEV
jgi:hypothetical protein